MGEIQKRVYFFFTDYGCNYGYEVFGCFGEREFIIICRCIWKNKKIYIPH